MHWIIKVNDFNGSIKMSFFVKIREFWGACVLLGTLVLSNPYLVMED